MNILGTGHGYSIISDFLFICISYLDIYSPMFTYFLFYAYIYGLFVAVTCIFLASNSAIFCQENTSGYIGVCKNYKIIINTKSKKSEIQNQRNQKYKIKDIIITKSKISEIQNLSILLTHKMDLFLLREHLEKETLALSNVGKLKCVLDWKVNKNLARLESQYKRDPH